MNVTKGLSVSVRKSKGIGGIRIQLTISNAIPRYVKEKSGRRVIHIADYHGKLPFKLSARGSEFQPSFVLKIYHRAKTTEQKLNFDFGNESTP